jgi:GxxExxY protein
MNPMVDLLYKNEVYVIIGAAMEVYNQLGPGFLEAIYQEALEIELSAREIPFCPRAELPINSRGQRLKKFYVADFLIYDKIIVEIKAIHHLTSIDEAQLINELKASGLNLGLLINFGARDKLEWQRKILTQKQRSKAHD